MKRWRNGESLEAAGLLGLGRAQSLSILEEMRRAWATHFASHRCEMLTCGAKAALAKKRTATGRKQSSGSGWLAFVQDERRFYG
jgi:hypothetical protein